MKQSHPNHALPANGGGPSRLKSPRLVAAAGELGSLGRSITFTRNQNNYGKRKNMLEMWRR